MGPPIAGVSARVVTDDGRPVAPDGETIGDLQVRGPTLFDGYVGRPEETAAQWTPDGWFRTGDVAAVDGQGWHRILGRRTTDLITTGGHRVGSAEIESCLVEHPGVGQAAVVGVPDDDLGMRVVAYVVGSGVSASDLAAFVAGRLARHKRPREVRFVDDLPRTELGKVRKDVLVTGDDHGEQWSGD